MSRYILSAGAIKLINKAVDDMFNRAKVRFLGPQAVSKAIGIGFKHELSLPGLFMVSCTEEGFKPDKGMLRSLLGVAEDYLDAANAKAKARVVQEVASFLQDAVTEGVVTDVETVLGGKMVDVWGEITADVRRIIDTESQTAKNYGSLESIIRIGALHGEEDPVTCFIPVRDEKRCDECTRLHLLEDELTPRAWYLSELGHGYHKKGDANPKIQGLHPNCFVGHSRLHTDRGLLTVMELYELGGPNRVVVDNRVVVRKSPANQFGKEVAGEVWLHRHRKGAHIREATPVYDTGVQPCLRITLDSGHMIEVTLDHNMWVDDNNMGKVVEAQSLKVGDKIPLLSGEGLWGNEHFPQLAELMGNLLGDGALNQNTSTATWHFFGNDIPYGRILLSFAQMEASRLLGAPSSLQHELIVSPPDDKYQVEQAQFNSRVLGKEMQSRGLSKNPRRVPRDIWKADRETVVAFLRGLYAADGHTEGAGGLAVVLGQNDLDFLREIQLLLSNLGIVGRIYSHGEPTDKPITYANGDVYEVHRKACWRLCVGGFDQVERFICEIGLGVPEKMKQARERLAQREGRAKLGSWRIGKVVSIEDIGEHQTYCLTEPMSNTVTVNGIVTQQCRCQISQIGPGWGFDSNGRITYIGPEHNEILHQRGHTRRQKLPSLKKDEDPLEKMAQTPFGFPQLGVQPVRDTPVVGAKELKTKPFLSIRQAVPRGIAADTIEATASRLADNPYTRGVRGLSTGFVKNPEAIQAGIDETNRRTIMPLSSDAMPTEDQIRGTKHHEDLHAVFSQVQQRYGKEARNTLAYNLFHQLPDDLREAAVDYNEVMSGTPLDHPHYEEEALAGLMNYLNSAASRDKYYQQKKFGDFLSFSGQDTGVDWGETGADRRSTDAKLKQAAKRLRTMAKEYVNEDWLKHQIFVGGQLVRADLVHDHTPFELSGLERDRLDKERRTVAKSEYDVGLLDAKQFFYGSSLMKSTKQAMSIFKNKITPRALELAAKWRERNGDPLQQGWYRDISGLIERAPVVIRFPSYIAPYLLKSGRYRNLHDPIVQRMEGGMGHKSTQLRGNNENALFGFDWRHDHRFRPVYGSLHYHHETPLVSSAPHGSWYGAAWLQLKDEVARTRTTLSPADSLDMFGSKGPPKVASQSGPAGGLHFGLYQDLHAVVYEHFAGNEAFQDAPLFSYGQDWFPEEDGWPYRGMYDGNYIEAQIHGGVRLGHDVDSIHISIDDCAPVPKRGRRGYDYEYGIYPTDKALNNFIKMGKKFGVPVYAHARLDEEPFVEVQTLYEPSQSEPLQKSTKKGLTFFERKIKPIAQSNAERFLEIGLPLTPDANDMWSGFTFGEGPKPLTLDLLRGDPAYSLAIPTIETAPIAVHFPINAAKWMMRSNRYQNMFHLSVRRVSGGGMGGTDYKVRAGAEHKVFNIPEGADHSIRPIYGALHLGHQIPYFREKGPCRDYGSAWLQLKPEVKQRSTFTPADSFDVDREFVFTQDQIHAAVAPAVSRRFNLKKISPGKGGIIGAYSAVDHPILDVEHALDRLKKGMEPSLDGYVEAQVHGGIRYDRDVDSVHVYLGGGDGDISNIGEYLSHKMYDSGTLEADSAARVVQFGHKFGLPVYVHIDPPYHRTAYGGLDSDYTQVQTKLVYDPDAQQELPFEGETLKKSIPMRTVLSAFKKQFQYEETGGDRTHVTWSSPKIPRLPFRYSHGQARSIEPSKLDYYLGQMGLKWDPSTKSLKIKPDSAQYPHWVESGFAQQDEEPEKKTWTPPGEFEFHELGRLISSKPQEHYDWNLVEQYVRNFAGGQGELVPPIVTMDLDGETHVLENDEALHAAQRLGLTHAPIKRQVDPS